MSDEMTIGGKQYISSKRAAEISDYTQDYIGQLARKRLIDAHRVGGLWYVSMDALLRYKEKAESYIPTPPQNAVLRDRESLVSFDGKDYVSASRAAEITGYHSDYVGQLARSGTVLSKQVGNRWYVERSHIVGHKRKKTACLLRCNPKRWASSDRKPPILPRMVLKMMQSRTSSTRVMMGTYCRWCRKRARSDRRECGMPAKGESHHLPIRVVRSYEVPAVAGRIVAQDTLGKSKESRFGEPD